VERRQAGFESGRRDANGSYFVVGIMKSAPARMPDGQRCVTAFCRV
jgi:hypothetical protein